MAEFVQEKLYPPIISETLPAFYKWNLNYSQGITKIVIPYSMNKAVFQDEIWGFALKIKTIQTNEIVFQTQKVIRDSDIKNKIILFTFTYNEQFEDFLNTIKIGQFLKIQVAYIRKKDETGDTSLSNKGDIGYYSTPGIIKYTSKPNIYIEEYKNNSQFNSTCTGIYEFGEDKTEKPYSYRFSLYQTKNSKDELLETSSWLLWNSSSLQVNYTFNIFVDDGQNCKIKYEVRTINNLEGLEETYSCISQYSENFSLFPFQLKAENNFDNGYVKLYFDIHENYTFISNTEDFVNYYNNKYFKFNTIIKSGGIYQLYNIPFSGDKDPYILIEPIIDEEENINQYEISYFNLNIESNKIIKILFKNNYNNKNFNIELYKKDSKGDYHFLQKISFSSLEEEVGGQKLLEEVEKWKLEDFIVEQGEQYQYFFRQYNDNEHSEKEESNIVTADFEDTFLWDGKRQLKIRFNPKVSSFKIDRLESKTDTIGSKYPHFFRNGNVEYREFPISGLISYHMDNDEWFVKYSEDLGILSAAAAERTGTAEERADNPWEKTETLDLTSNNMYIERKFKLMLLDWLGNGKVKLFKSPAEGNYLVRLMNISLSPEDRLSRMLHSFSCTAYEAEALTPENLYKVGILEG